MLGCGQTVLQWSLQCALHGACRFNRPWIEIALLRRQRAGSPAFEAQHWRLPAFCCVLIDLDEMSMASRMLFFSLHSSALRDTEMDSAPSSLGAVSIFHSIHSPVWGCGTSLRCLGQIWGDFGCRIHRMALGSASRKTENSSRGRCFSATPLPPNQLPSNNGMAAQGP